MQMQALRWGPVRWTLASKCSMPGQVCRCLQTCWLHISAASWLWGEALKAAATIDAARGRCLVMTQQQWAHTHTSMTASLRAILLHNKARL